MDKVKKIKELIKQGKTTREIARELRVSLRDIHRVRMQEGIDIGALERDRDRLQGELVSRRQEVSRLQQEIQRLREEKQGLEAEIKRRKAEVLKVVTPIKPIYFPQNFTDIDEYLKNLSDNQLKYLLDTVVHLYGRRMYDRDIRPLLGK